MEGTVRSRLSKTDLAVISFVLSMSVLLLVLMILACVREFGSESDSHNKES